MSSLSIEDPEYYFNVWENVRACADATVVGVWTNSLTGKKLYNQAYIESLLKELEGEQVAVPYKEDNGHGWAIPMSALNKLKSKYIGDGDA